MPETAIACKRDEIDEKRSEFVSRRIARACSGCIFDCKRMTRSGERIKNAGISGKSYATERAALFRGRARRFRAKNLLCRGNASVAEHADSERIAFGSLGSKFLSLNRSSFDRKSSVSRLQAIRSDLQTNSPTRLRRQLRRMRPDAGDVPLEHVLPRHRQEHDRDPAEDPRHRRGRRSCHRSRGP